jgi:hypothetical protein
MFIRLKRMKKIIFTLLCRLYEYYLPRELLIFVSHMAEKCHIELTAIAYTTRSVAMPIILYPRSLVKICDRE